MSSPRPHPPSNGAGPPTSNARTSAARKVIEQPAAEPISAGGWPGGKKPANMTVVKALSLERLAQHLHSQENETKKSSRHPSPPRQSGRSQPPAYHMFQPEVDQDEMPVSSRLPAKMMEALLGIEAGHEENKHNKSVRSSRNRKDSAFLAAASALASSSITGQHHHQSQSTGRLRSQSVTLDDNGNGNNNHSHTGLLGTEHGLGLAYSNGSGGGGGGGGAGVSGVSGKRSPRKPPLLTSLEAFIDKELSMLPQVHKPGGGGGGGGEGDEDGGKPSALRLRVFSEAFERFISEFRIYKPFLALIKKEYDSTISHLLTDSRAAAAERAQSSTRDVEQAHLVARAAAEQVHRETALLEALGRSETTVGQLTAQVADLTTQLNRQREVATRAYGDYRNMQKACLSLTAGMSKVAEERTREKAEMMGRQSEVLQLRIQFDKALSEADRLRAQVQDLVEAQSQTVPAAVAIAKEQQLRQARDEVELLQAQHRALIVRYGLLKGALERAWKKSQRKKHGNSHHHHHQHQHQDKGATFLTQDGGHSAGQVQVISSSPTPMPPPTPYSLDEWGRTTPTPTPLPGAHAGGLHGHGHGLGRTARIQQKVSQMMEGAEHPTHVLEALLSRIEELERVGRQLAGKQRSGNGLSAGSALGQGAEDGLIEADTFMASSSHLELSSLVHAHLTVPFMQGVGRVRDFYLTKRDTERLVNEVWDAREMAVAAEKEREGQQDMTMHGYHSSSSSSSTAGGGSIDVVGGAVVPASTGSAATPPSSTPAIPPSASDDSLPFISSIPMHAFITQYIASKHPLSRAHEVHINFIKALERFSSDSDCRILLKVITGELPEVARQDQLTMLAQLEAELKKEEELAVRSGSASANVALVNLGVDTDQCCGMLPLEVFMKVLRRVLPAKTEQNLSRLERVLRQEAKPGGLISYEECLGEDENGNQGRFCEMLRDQHLSEIASFTKSIVESIKMLHEQVRRNPTSSAAVSAAVERDGPAAAVVAGEAALAGKMSVALYREAIEYADSDKPRGEVNVYLARGYRRPVDEILILEMEDATEDVDTFITRLSSTLLKKSPPAKGPSAMRR